MRKIFLMVVHLDLACQYGNPKTVAVLMANNANDSQNLHIEETPLHSQKQPQS